MKQFSLEEYLKNPTRKVVTRGGESVRIICTDYYGERPIIAKIEESEYSHSFYEDGRFLSFGESSHCDLFFAPEKHERWINLHKDNDGIYASMDTFKTKDEAEAVSCSSCIATVKIEWEE